MGESSIRKSAANLLTPGARVGRYCIEDLIARGGMGEVWLATAHGVGGFAKKVVLKTILPELAEDAAYVKMLINEASIAARLNHPNIVQVFDLEFHDGRYFIAMEYLPGRTLNQLMKRLDGNDERLPPWTAAIVIANVCDGLQYAHDYTDDDHQCLNLLHRDISPSNIMLTFGGGVTILDFGIAKASTGEPLTASGGVKGKFHYMPPERIRGLPGDRRSDIYSLGVVLYQMLAWRRPFSASNDAALLDKILRKKPAPIAGQAPWVNRRLEAITAKAMAKRPEARYQEAAHLAADLRAYLRESGESGEAAEIASYVREVFADAPEVRNLIRSERSAKAGVTDDFSSESASFEILEIIPNLEDDDDSTTSVEEERGADPFASSPHDHDDPDDHDEPVIAFGSSEPPAMTDEPVSVYDMVAARRLRPERPTDVAALFGAPVRRRRGDDRGVDLFDIRRLDPEPERKPRVRAASEAPFVGDREQAEPSWPWARLPKKSQ